MGERKERTDDGEWFSDQLDASSLVPLDARGTDTASAADSPAAGGAPRQPAGHHPPVVDDSPLELDPRDLERGRGTLAPRSRRTAGIGLALLLALGVAGAAWFFLIGRPGSSRRDGHPVNVTVVVKPRRARVLLDGVVQPTRKLALDSARAYNITVRARGYRPFTKLLRAQHDTVLEVDLVRR